MAHEARAQEGNTIPTVVHKGNEVALTAPLPAVGTKAPAFELVDIDLSEVQLSDFEGQIKILNIVPSLDTTICSISATKFNEEAQKLKDAVIINISMDLPFANKRFCELGHIEDIRALSAFRAPDFGSRYGLLMQSGVLRGLLARAVIVVDQNDIIRYIELVPDIGKEPNYDGALQAVKTASNGASL